MSDRHTSGTAARLAEQLSTAGTSDDWADRARCRGLDPDQFFVRGAAQARRAIAVCGRCEVKESCLRYALENGIDFGVWGGLTERQRRAHQRKLLANAS